MARAGLDKLSVYLQLDSSIFHFRQARCKRQKNTELQSLSKKLYRFRSAYQKASI